jgi:hypothetical protein
MGTPASDKIIQRLNETNSNLSGGRETAWMGKALYMRTDSGFVVVKDRDARSEWDGVFWSHWCGKLSTHRASVGQYN